MAADMIPPAHAPAFLAAHGWDGCEIRPLAGDASFRRYFRIHRGGETAVLMDAPPEREDIGPFIRIAEELIRRDLSAPRPLAVDRKLGLLLLEDFGDLLLGTYLSKKPRKEEQTYRTAISILEKLSQVPAPADFALYDEATLLREASLFTQWYAPALDLDIDAAGFAQAWHECLAGIAEASAEYRTLVLRDYHADNLMVLRRPELKSLGLLDFQDALAGHPAYDLVSLLQDARRDVDPALERQMLDEYVLIAGFHDEDEFRAHYEILGAQRNTKIIGIFTRLWKRDGKRHYLSLQPRVWGYLERNLAHPALAPVKAWFDANVPAEKRAAAWLGAAA